MDNELDQREILERHMLAMSDQGFRKYVAMWFADLDRITTRHGVGLAALRDWTARHGEELEVLPAVVSKRPHEVLWKPLF